MKIRCVKCGSAKDCPHLKAIPPHFVCSCGGTYVEDKGRPANTSRCGTCAVFNTGLRAKCGVCDGSGAIVTDPVHVDCPACHGTGKVPGCDIDDPNCIIKDSNCYVPKKENLKA